LSTVLQTPKSTLYDICIMNTYVPYTEQYCRPQARKPQKREGIKKEHFFTVQYSTVQDVIL